MTMPTPTEPHTSKNIHLNPLLCSEYSGLMVAHTPEFPLVRVNFTRYLANEPCIIANHFVAGANQVNCHCLFACLLASSPCDFIDAHYHNDGRQYFNFAEDVCDLLR
jgi:hypothetical protein